MKKYLLFLILLFPFFNIHAIQLSYGDDNYNYNLPDSCNSFFFYTKFGKEYLVCGSEDYYVIEQPYYADDYGNFNYFKKYRVSISQDLYNSWLSYINSNIGSGYVGSNPLIFSNESGIGYYDNIEDKYYAFYGNPDISNISIYSISKNSDFTTNLTYYSSTLPLHGIRIYASNVNLYLYSNDGLNQPQRIHYAPYHLKIFNVRFHLNGGTVITSSSVNSGIGSSGNAHGGGHSIHYEDYSIKVYDKFELDNYLNSLTVKNDLVTFNQWYYDEQLTQPFNFNNDISTDLNLYASYQYTSVDSVIKNINFNEYTFTNDYQYAVISVKNNFSQGMYIGLGFNFQYLDAYKYIISDNSFTNGSFISLSSIGSINDKYYYHLGQLDNDSAMVVVLDKANLIKLNSNDELEHYYTFLVSNNCYVYFTNDLSRVNYYVPVDNGSDSTLIENGDISKNYDYTRNFILDSNTDIVTKFISLIKNANFNIFTLFKNLWYKFRAYKILNYFMILCFGSVIIALVKGGSRN